MSGAPGTLYLLHCDECGLLDVNEGKEIIRSKRIEHEKKHGKKTAVTVGEYGLRKSY